MNDLEFEIKKQEFLNEAKEYERFQRFLDAIQTKIRCKKSLETHKI